MKLRSFKIIERLHSKVNLEIAKESGRDYRTVKKVVIRTAQCYESSDKEKIRKQAPVSHRAMRQITKEVRCTLYKLVKEVFENL